MSVLGELFDTAKGKAMGPTLRTALHTAPLGLALRTMLDEILGE
jgi:hypothetical protein